VKSFRRGGWVVFPSFKKAVIPDSGIRLEAE
jgi:hypothetical protein